MTSNKSKQISRELALGGFADVRDDPDLRHISKHQSSTVKQIGQGYCGKLIKEGIIYKQGASLSQRSPITIFFRILKNVVIIEYFL